MKLSFIGGGKMAESIVHGVLAAKLAVGNDIAVGEPIIARLCPAPTWLCWL